MHIVENQYILSDLLKGVHATSGLRKHAVYREFICDKESLRKSHILLY